MAAEVTEISVVAIGGYRGKGSWSCGPRGRLLLGVPICLYDTAVFTNNGADTATRRHATETAAQPATSGPLHCVVARCCNIWRPYRHGHSNTHIQRFKTHFISFLHAVVPA